MNNYSIKECTYEGRVGPQVGLSRVRHFVGNRGSGQRFADSVRVYEKRPVDNSVLPSAFYKDRKVARRGDRRKRQRATLTWLWVLLRYTGFGL